jgi:hypothetical protein
VQDFVASSMEAVRADRTAHDLRLERLLPSLAEEFAATRTPEEIRACADAILEKFDDAPVRSFVLTLARREAIECLRAKDCYALS